jgi:3-hydroxybutyryl-CoA dehydrogenase
MCVTGLIEQKDLSGIDTHARAQAAIVPHLYHEAAPSPVIMDKLERNELGIKTGIGFYDWRSMDIAGYRGWAEDLLGRLIRFIEAERRPQPPAADGD